MVTQLKCRTSMQTHAYKQTQAYMPMWRSWTTNLHWERIIDSSISSVKILSLHSVYVGPTHCAFHALSISFLETVSPNCTLKNLHRTWRKIIYILISSHLWMRWRKKVSTIPSLSTSRLENCWSLSRADFYQHTQQLQNYCDLWTIRWNN